MGEKALRTTMYLAHQTAHALAKLLIAGVGVDHRCHRTGMPGEALGEEEVPGRSVNIRHSRVTQGMKRIQPTKARSHLPPAYDDLDPAA